MIGRPTIVVALASMVLAAGCNDGASDVTSGPGYASGHGVRLLLLDSKEQGGVDGMLIGPSDRFVIVDIRLENTSHDPPVSVAYPLFSIRSQTGVEYLGSTYTELLDDGCDSLSSVAADGYVECSLAFEVPHEQTVGALVYRTDDTELVLSFESEQCSPCGNDCAVLSSDPDNCGECGREISKEQSCVDGEVLCNDGLTPCGAGCFDTQTDPEHCGGCSSVIPDDQECIDGVPVCPEATPDLCYSHCVDLQTSDYNCGECGREVPNCVDGDVSCAATEEWCAEQGICTNIHTDRANCGECGNKCGGYDDCIDGECLVHYSVGDPTAACGPICTQHEKMCARVQVTYSGLSTCGDFDDDHTLDLTCSDVPPAEIEIPHPDCNFLGKDPVLDCWCR